MRAGVFSANSEEPKKRLMGFLGSERLLFESNFQFHAMNDFANKLNDEMPFDEMYATLRRIAQAALKGEKAGHTLQPTALVHDYLLSLPNGFSASAEENVKLVRIAGWRMRRLLIDHARRKARRLGGSPTDRVELEAVDAQNKAVRFPDLELLDDLLRDLQAENAEAAAVVEMRFFCGLTHEEIARALGRSVPTIERRWHEAKEWLGRRASKG